MFLDTIIHRKIIYTNMEQEEEFFLVLFLIFNDHLLITVDICLVHQSRYLSEPLHILVVCVHKNSLADIWNLQINTN